MDLFDTAIARKEDREELSHPIPYISAPDEISNEDYHRAERYKRFISSTSLKNYLMSPKHARYMQLNPKKQTPAMEFGSLYHDMLAIIANKGSFDLAKKSVTVFEPPINLKTGCSYGKDSKAYQEAMTEQSAACGGKLVDADDHKLAIDMISELLSGDDLVSNEIRWILEMGAAEQSHFLEYEGYGFKYRTDLKTKSKIFDWKTCNEGAPKPEQFSKVIADYHYDVSAAMYQFFEHELTGIWKPFFWVVQEKCPPYSFTILDSQQWSWEFKRDGNDILPIPKIGALIFLKLMEQHIYCNENNYFPGYSIFVKPDNRGHRIGLPDVPGYYRNQYSEMMFYNSKKG